MFLIQFKNWDIMARIGFTTSRNPATKTRSFINDIVKVIPESMSVTRGSSNVDLTLNEMIHKDCKTAAIVNSVKGNPNFVRMFDLSTGVPKKLAYAIKIRGLTLSREIRTVKTNQPQYSILISTLKNEFKENALKRFLNIKKHSIEKLEETNYITAYADYIEENGEEFIFVEFTNKKDRPVGPRMKLKVIPREI